MKAFHYYENLKLPQRRIFFKKIIIAILYMILALTFWNYCGAQTFNTTIVAADACNSWGAGITTKSKNITTVGLPAGGLTNTGVVLKQINIKLGNSSCKKALNTYRMTLTSPNGVTIDVHGLSGIGGITSTGTTVWLDSKFRDNQELELIRTYSSTTAQYQYSPFSIGYYRVESANSFANFNDGSDPNGTWTWNIYGATSGSQIAIEKVELVFGTKTVVTDVTGSSANDLCSGAVCISNASGVVVGHNRTGGAAPQNYVNGETTTAPGYFPGTTVGTCGWNGADNNSAWFYFTASSTTAYITISGMTGSTSSAQQMIVLDKNSACANAATVPVGGCPDDETINNKAYANYAGNMNGGGTTTSGNIYSNGITQNCEFNLSSLTVGESYFLYIDGNAGANSPFYIEIPSGISAGCTVLPISLKSFYGTNACSKNYIYWSTISERNNDYFMLERSLDGINFNEIAKIKGAGNSSSEMLYQYEDYFTDINSIYYYRLTQTDFDGKKEVFEDIYVKNDCKKQNVFYTPNKILITGFDHIESIIIFDILGRKVIETKETSIDFNGFASAFYNVVVTSKNGNQTSNKIYKP